MSLPSSKNRNIISLTSHFNHGALHASKATHKRNRTNEQSASSKIQCDYLMLKDVAGTNELKVLSMYVRTFGYGMSTVVGTKGPTDMFATMWQ